MPGAVPGTCAAGSTCQALNNGIPKYGDYNGMACAGRWAFGAWASNTPQLVGTPAGNTWLRAYRAESTGPLFSRWRSKLAVERWWQQGP
jgi:hypothetical protein